MDLIEVSKRNSTDVARHPWELARFEVVRSLLKNILKNKPDFNVLDIGCGDIFFVSRLADYYPQAHFYAIDIAFSDEIIDRLKASIKDKNIYLFKTLDEANTHLKAQADLVLLLDVVEHIEHDKQFLSDLANNKAVTPATQVMITVPAYQNLFCSHDHFLGHYRRYTNSTLLKTIQVSGFKKIEIGYFFSLLIPPRILQVVKEKFLKPSGQEATTGLVEWNKGSFITNTIKGVLIADQKITQVFKKLTGISLPGLSNYIICKKSV